MNRMRWCKDLHGTRWKLLSQLEFIVWMYGKVYTFRLSISGTVRRFVLAKLYAKRVCVFMCHNFTFQHSIVVWRRRRRRHCCAI